MMRRSLSLLVAAALTLVLTSSVSSQEPPPSPPPPSSPPPAPMPRPANPPPPPSNQNVRVDVTIALKADAKPLTKTLSMVTADGRLSQGRAGIEIPVPTQSFTPNPGGTSPPIVSYNYRNVSMNVDATPQILDATKVMLRLKLNFATVYKPEVPGQSQASFGNGQHDVWGIVFESGKPMVVTQSTDGETGREYSVEVKATILK